MLAVILAAAVVTGVLLLFNFRRTRDNATRQNSPLEKDIIMRENGIIANKEYFLMKGIIKY